MSLSKWIKNKVTMLSIATSNVEKQSIKQLSIELDNMITNHQGINQGTLMDNLINGEMTEDVKQLRWRMFKVLDNLEGLESNVLEYTDGDSPLSANVTRGKKHKEKLRGVKMDKFDDYPIEIVVDNSKISLGGLGSIEGVDMLIHETKELSDTIKYDEELATQTATLGSVSNDIYNSSIKSKTPIIINREFTSKFNIEDYTTKLNIRGISETEKLLEFYISEYQDTYNRNSNLFLAQVKKAIKTPRVCDFLNIETIGFIANKTPGAKDLHEYQYKKTNFDKIVKFDGHYVIKFKCEVTMDGEYLLERYRSEVLDEKYKNNEAKN